MNGLTSIGLPELFCIFLTALLARSLARPRGSFFD